MRPAIGLTCLSSAVLGPVVVKPRSSGPDCNAARLPCTAAWLPRLNCRLLLTADPSGNSRVASLSSLRDAMLAVPAQGLDKRARGESD